MLEVLYCLRFFRPLPKGRLCYNNNHSIERSIQWRNAEDSPLSFRSEVVFEVLRGESSPVSEVCRRHNLNENQLSQWKRQLLENAPSLFESTDKQSSEVSEKRIAHLEQLVGRMAVALDIQKKLLTELD